MIHELFSVRGLDKGTIIVSYFSDSNLRNLLYLITNDGVNISVNQKGAIPNHA